MKFFHHHKKWDLNFNELNSFSYYFPPNIVKGKKTLNFISEIIKDKKKTGVMADSFVMKNYYAYLNIQEEKPEKIIFNGECSSKEFFRLKQLILNKGIDCLICMGGGKAMDTGKLLKRDIKGLLLILVPTSAATCAAATSVSVIYDEKGAYAGTVDSVCADFIIIDYEIFHKLPLAFFSAGIADTIAKYFEISVEKKFLKEEDIYCKTILDLSEKLYKRLKEITYNRWEQIDETVKEELTDINIIFSGIISLLGRFNITISAAHTIAHSLTVINCSQKFLHGEYVALGLFLQENLLKNRKNAKELQNIFMIHDLPLKLSQLNIYKKDINEIFEFYVKLKQNEKITFPVNDKLVYNQLNKSL